MPARDIDLAQLLAIVVRTRESQRLIRGASAAHGEAMKLARRACLRAVEDYTGALQSRRLPVPYQLHMELALLRAVCGKGEKRNSPADAAASVSQR